MDTFDQEILISGIFWLPYTLLLWFLFYEHISRIRNTQSLILLCLALGALFRCVWFFCYFSFVDYVVSEVVNRFAMLFQFSGLSVLLYMWLRAISIAKLTDTAYNESSRTMIAISKQTVAPKDRKYRLERYQEANQAVLDKVAGGKSYQLYYRITVVVNALVWAFVLGTLAITSKMWYNINIISISIACLGLAGCTLLVGLRVSIALHEALKPVYLSSGGTPGYSQEQTPRCACMGQYGARCERLLGCCGLCSLYAFIFNYQQSDTRQGLQMQREVLKVILSVSTITSFFFLVRSFVFLYRPVVKEYAGHEEYSNEIDGTWAYPFFYYQIPELVPNLAIALAISPPNGVLRQWARLVVYCWEVVGFYTATWCHCCCHREGFTPQYPQPRPSVFDGKSNRQTKSDFHSYVSSSETTARQAGTSLVLEAMERGSAGSHTSSSSNKTQHLTFGLEGDAVLSPVHAASANKSSPPRSQNILISSSSSAPKTGAFSVGKTAFQVSCTEGEQGQGGRSHGSGRTARSVLNPFGRSPIAGSLGFPSPSSSPRSTGSKQLAISLRKNAARGTWETYFEGEEEEQDWAQQRRDSADIAEMLYRINSFSTNEGASQATSLASPASSLTGPSSVESNTILNSRRQPLRGLLGWNHNASHRCSEDQRTATRTEQDNSSRWGWFTGV